MITSRHSNNPVWKDIFTSSKLPSSLSKLDEIAHNLWWAWHPEAQDIFKEIDETLWQKTQGNPVAVLQSLSQTRIDEITQDASLQARVAEVYEEFKKYVEEPADQTLPSVAYFSMEYGLSNVLKIYSGGLGVLAGDYLKEASDSNIDLVAVGFLYRYGYFDQSITADGQQVAQYQAQNFDSLPIQQVFNNDGSPFQIELPFLDHSLRANIWKVNVGRISLYLLDTDIMENQEWDRTITHQLYGGDWENRMRQEYLLGIGGITLLEKLNIKKDVYHCNEGHAAFINLERLALLINKENRSFDEALEIVRASSLYTVHTPVPAGHDYFEESLFKKYLEKYAGSLKISFQDLINLGRENPGSNEKFSMSVFALNTAQEANGVSWLHGKVSQQMFAPVWKGYFPEELHVGYVTNGVHLPTWTRKKWLPFIDKYISKNLLQDQDKETIWSKIQSIPNEEIWQIRRALKTEFIEYVRENYSERWLKNNGNPSQAVEILESINPNALLIGFGRRFATYKRAHLLFTDLDRLSELVNNKERPIQFIFTGKAHPTDGGGQGLIKHIIEISKRPEFSGKIIFLENYDMRVAAKLIAGVDVWLNTPTRPLEASGTSGMKALMNGVLNFSVLDGWWYEGYRPNAGWELTDKRTFQNQQYQDQLDAATIYRTFEEQIIPTYYKIEDGKDYSDEWIQCIKNSMSYILPHYTMRRMLLDYINKYYFPLAKRHHSLRENNDAIVKEIVEWKKKIESTWDSIEVERCSININNGETQATVGDCFTVDLIVDRKNLEKDLEAELVITRQNSETQALSFVRADRMKLISSEGTKDHFQLNMKSRMPGYNKLAVRLYPFNEKLPHRMDFAYVKWIKIS